MYHVTPPQTGISIYDAIFAFNPTANIISYSHP